MKLFFACLLFATLLRTAHADEDKIEPKEFRVYEAVLSDPAYLQPNTLLFIFDDHTEGTFKVFCGCKTPEEFIGMCEINNFKVDHELASEFFKKNQQTYPLPKEFHFGFDVEIKTISPDQKKAFFTGDIERGWKAFYRAYPNCGGIIAVSRVAYSADGDTALVYTGESSGGMAGGGILHLLKRQENGWKEVNQFLTWAS